MSALTLIPDHVPRDVGLYLVIILPALILGGPTVATRFAAVLEPWIKRIPVTAFYVSYVILLGGVIALALVSGFAPLVPDGLDGIVSDMPMVAGFVLALVVGGLAGEGAFRLSRAQVRRATRRALREAATHTRRQPASTQPATSVPSVQSGDLPLLMLVALGEELAFRGLALAWLLAFLALPVAGLIVTLAFALAHLHFGGQVMVSKALLGVLLLGLMWGVGSIAAPIAAHMIYNLRAGLMIRAVQPANQPASQSSGRSPSAAARAHRAGGW